LKIELAFTIEKVEMDYRMKQLAHSIMAN